MRGGRGKRAAVAGGIRGRPRAGAVGEAPGRWRAGLRGAARGGPGLGLRLQPRAKSESGVSRASAPALWAVPGSPALLRSPVPLVSHTYFQPSSLCVARPPPRSSLSVPHRRRSFGPKLSSRRILDQFGPHRVSHLLGVSSVLYASSSHRAPGTSTYEETESRCLPRICLFSVGLF